MKVAHFAIIILALLPASAYAGPAPCYGKDGKPIEFRTYYRTTNKMPDGGSWVALPYEHTDTVLHRFVETAADYQDCIVIQRSIPPKSK